MGNMHTSYDRFAGVLGGDSPEGDCFPPAGRLPLEQGYADEAYPWRRQLKGLSGSSAHIGKMPPAWSSTSEIVRTRTRPMTR